MAGAQNPDRLPNNLAPQAGDIVTRTQIVQADGTAVIGGITSGIPTINGELFPDTTGTFTNATQATSVTSAANLDGYGTALVSVSGTYGTATGVFEASDDAGTTWFSVDGARSDSATVEAGYTSLTNTTRAWFITIAGFDQFRVRSTAVASGTVIVRVSVSSAPTSEGTTVAVGGSLPTGANTIGAVTGSGTFTVDTELPAAAALSDTQGNPTTPIIGAALLGWDGFNSQMHRVGVGTGFGDTITGGNALAVLPYLFGGATWDRPRNPVTFKSFASTAITAGTGATIWTPAAGKKFRVMGWAISSSVAGVIILGDNLAATVIARSPAVAAAGYFQLGAGDMGNGILSAAANNVLKVDGPTGNVAGMVWGTEE